MAKGEGYKGTHTFVEKIQCGLPKCHLLCFALIECSNVSPVRKRFKFLFNIGNCMICTEIENFKSAAHRLYYKVLKNSQDLRFELWSLGPAFHWPCAGARPFTEREGKRRCARDPTCSCLPLLSVLVEELPVSSNYLYYEHLLQPRPGSPQVQWRLQCQFFWMEADTWQVSL